MKITDIQTGKPSADGRYVIFIRCAAVQAKDWVEPIIATWHGNRWHTTMIAVSNILGWIGPIPVMKVSDIEATYPIGENPVYQETVAKRAQEFDL